MNPPAQSVVEQKQRGVALITALILLLVLTVVGVSSLANTVLEERMAGNMRERQIALQAAEAALREGERRVRSESNIHERVFYNNGVSDGDPTADNDGDSCRNGYCLPRERAEAPTTCERWALSGNDCVGFLNVWNTAGRHHTYQLTSSLTPDSSLNLPAPKYIIEFLAYTPAPGAISNCDSDGNGVNDTPPGTENWPYCPSDPQLYRITALGFGSDDKTRVLLQSTYLKAE